MSISHSNRDCGKFDALPLPALFEAQVRRTPQATALWYEGITVSYAELNLRANRVAHILIDAGIGPEDIVALALPRSIELVAVLLAILKAGAAYLPLDPEYPPERLAFMLEDATPAALITTEALVPAMPSARNTIVFDSREFEARLAQSQTADPTDEERSAALHCANLAYVIYTSGSTGKPKGVMVTHAGIANLAASQIERFAISPDSAILQFASVSFDAAVSELCIAVLAGARLVLAPASRLLPGDALANLIAQAGVTHATLPPSALAVMPHDALPTGFTLIVAGEACPLHLVQSWSRGRRMINAYGPTETTVCATMSAPLDGSRTPPLGEAVANTDIYLLDEFLEPVPPGVPGELYVSGIGLARGYRGRPDLTAERFLPDPHFADGRRMYRTGDLVCRAQDGTLDFLGRIDHQVKIRGFRIELGEIEAALARHPDVLQAAVIAREDSQGQKQIVGYVVAAPGAAPDSAALRRHVGLQLPDYMVPAAILALAAIPLTPNGKLDREKLPDPVFSGTGRSEAASREETMLAALFAEVLSLEQVDMEESFFDLGGHSLAATRLISRIRSTFGVKLELDDIFDTPNVAGLAVRLGGAPAVEKQAAGIARTSRETPLALSFSQQRLWFLDQMAPGSPFYNMPCLVKLSGALDRALVQRSLDEIVRRHESLRTTFVAGDGEPVQVVGPAFAVSLPYTDLSTLTEAEREPRAQELALAQKRTAFDLATGPLIRAELLRLEQRQHLLMLTVHHTVGDGWSMGLLVNELTQLYQAYESNAPSPLAELPIQYADYAQWQRRHVDGDLLATQLDYWKSKLAGSPALIALPTDKPRPAVQSFSGSAHLDCTLPVGLSASLHAFAARHNATLFMAILAALDALLMRWSGQSDLVVGTVIAGRTSEELEPMIGCFINFLPLRATCNADDTPSALIAQLAATVREAYANQDTPFEKITEAVKPVRDAGHNPIFNVGLLLQNFPEPASAQGQLHTEMLPIAQDTATLDLRFVAQETAHGLHLSCEYRTDLFEQSTIVALLDALHASLAYCAGRPDAPLLELSLPAGLVQQGATRREIVPETLKLAIAATFTSEPLAETLSYWMRQCALEADIEFAPYNQVMQTLLDPQGAFAARRNDVNIVLVRIEDWLRYADSAAPAFDIMQQRADDLLDAVAEAAARLGAPLLVGFCRASAAILAQPEMARHIAQLEQRMVARLRETAGVYPVPSEESARLYPVEHYDDVHGDELGHVPYTPEMFTALATLLARKVFTLHSRPFKVVVLDCDETLWRGVCGESGPLGVEVTEEHRFLQRFMIEQFESGMLLCLASKNSAADVDAVFAQHPGMLLKADHIVASRVNWLPKSQNIRQLAQELQLGLDSFIFLDDNPLECAEVAANCPGVLVLQLPAQSARIPAFLDHVWAFDRLSVTADARQRTRQYKENREREAVRTISASFDEFLASLKLDVAISGLHAAQLERAAELTQRTNQFNLRPQPRNAAQLQALDAQCLIVEVRDRFGDYGLTGVVAYTVDGPALTVDTFLLSCRILGRGVEHKVLAHLAGAAQEAGCDAIALPYIETGRNQPVLNFLHSIVQPDGTSYRIPVATALALKPTQSTSEQPMPAAAEKQRPGAGKTLPHSAFYMRTASELNNAMRIAQDVADMARAARQSMPDAAHYTAPEGESEQAIAAIWAAMLHQDQIGRHANFFDLGGHSLLATQVVSKIRTAFHIDLPLRALFEHPTVAELAAALERRRGADPVADSVADPAVAPIPALPRNGPMPLSFAQQRLWFLDQFESGSALYNMPATLRLRGRLDVAALSRAFNDIVARHEALRTTFALVDETAHQVLAPHLAIAPVLVDLTSLPRDAREAEARRLALDEACRPFDLAAGPLLRVTIVRLREDGPESEHFLLFTMHHIVSDGWSMGILLKEIAALYAAHVQGLPVALPPLPIQYADFSQWQRQWLADGVLARQLDYWTAKLRGIPSLLALPTDRPRPAAKTYRGASLAFTLPAPVTAGLQALAKATHGTLFMTLAAAFNVLLARYSGQDDICIGTPIANRNRAEIEPLIGFFVNTLVLRAQVDPDASFMALLEQVRATALEAYANQDVPFEQLVDALNPERHVSHSPLFQVMLALQNVAIDDLQLPGVALQRADVDTGIAKFDLTLTLVEEGDCLHGSLEYNTDLFDRATAERMAAHFANLAGAIVAAPGTRIAELDMLGAAERHTLLHVWNDTAADYPRELCIHQLFEAQVLRTPDAIALSCADASLSYAALNRRANRLAHLLLEKGMARDQLVGICLERSIDSVVAVLATLKAGAAYVPLDPAYPLARLSYVVQDAALKIVVTQSAIATRMPFAEQNTLCLDDAGVRQALASQAETDIDAGSLGLEPGNLAYVIYTSGSTGRPKGVRAEHRAMVNRICWMERRFPSRPDDVFCHKTTIAFVDHVAEIFQPLMRGRRLVLVAQDDVTDTRNLIGTIERESITRITVVPSLLQAMLDDPAAPGMSGLRQIVSSGEALTVRLARHCKRILPATRLINLYGSTEIGADATWHEFGSLSDEHEVLRHFSTDVAAGSAIPHADAARPWRELAALFTDTAIPHAPLATKEYFQRLDEQVIPNLVDVSQASYIGHMTSKLPNFAPAIAELITGLNQNLVKIETSKAMTFIERQALAAMHRLFFGGDKSDYDSSTQDPMQVFGVLVSGGSVANVTALWYARNRALLGSGIAKADLLRQGYSASLHARGYKKGVILGTRLLHYSVKKAFSLFGLGQDCFIEVEQTEAMRMSVPDLERKIAQCQKNGYLILAVIGIAGATETGTVDPLADIAAVAARHGIHFHVDAAWGGAFQFSPTHSGRLAGIERADSITICAHKQLYLPQGISLCLFRDPRGAGAISTHAEYQAKEGSFDLGQYSLEGSKPANALHLHAGLHLLAHSGYAWLIDQGMAKTRYFVQLIEQSPAFELVGPYPDLNIVNYRYVPLALRNKPRLSRTVDDAASMNAAVETIQALQFEQGKTFVSRTRVLPAAGAGETVSVFRVVLSNPLTTKENLHEVLNDQLRIARSFIAGEEALPDTDFLAPPDAQTAPEDGLVPIGKPIQNARVYVLDRTRKLQPAGIVGELYVGGDCVARNYLNQPEQSAERFLPDPFSDAPGARMYRTGDLARWSADGTLEYLGRTDQQVKIRGLRIELNEIENVLSAHWSLKDVALAAHEAAAGGGQLIAYVVPEAGVEPGRYAEFIDALRNHAQQQLPEYMVPARFVILDALPLSPNGKVDRKALPAPEAGSGIDPQPGERIAPRDATEQRVAQIWAEVLKTGDIGATDNFFHLGGHSLLATVAISKLRNAFRADFPLRLMFEAPTVAALALRIGQIVAGQRDANWEEIRPAPRDGNLPLSFAQQRLWFLDQFESDKAVYNLSAAMRLTGELDVPALHRTLNDVVRRHDALRTRFSSNAGTPFQVVDAHLELPLAITDLTSLPHAEREAKVQWLAQDEARKPFDLEHGPLLRISLIRLRRDQHLFLFTIHHIVADGWSMQVLIRETAALYSAFIAGLPSPLPELSLQYGDFAQWQRKWLQGEVLERQLAYWKNKLAGIPSLLSLPTDAPRPAMQTFRGASRSFDVSRQTVASLHALSQRTQGTLFMTLAAALGVFLARYSGQRDICIGTPIANRNRAEIEPLIGFFVNTLVLRVAIDDEQPFADLLSQVRDTALEAYANQDVPFEQVVEAVKPERQISHSPLFQVMLILQNAGAGKLALPGVEMQPLDIENTVSKFDLSFTMVEEGEQLHASVEYNTDLFEPATMERMVRHFTRMLDAVAANAQMPTGDLPLLDDAEQRRQLYQWNDTATTYPVATPLHLMFEAQALATPQRVAMRAGAEEISYADLNRRANQLAHHLRSLGVAPDTLVAVCTERSVDMVVALLAVLKAGAAYVPLDPTYPAERLSHMLADARPKVLLTQHALAGYLPAGGAIALELDTQRELWASQPADNPSNRTLPNHLAYVIYTSGSTGKPKGVGVRQASLANFIHSMRRKPGIAADDVMLGLTSLSFDIAALELFLPLCAGAKLVLATREEASDPSCLLSLIEDNEVTIMQATPATWRMLVAHRWPMQQHMLRVLCGGEALPDDLARQLLERAGTVWNMYGPTETTIWSSVRCMTLADPAISIGWPIANTQFHILDERFHPAPVGVAGHLYIAGDGLARGYLNRPDLTAERFIPNPFGEKGSRMYDTGDVARYMPDGSVEYLGRMDGQVKVRGFRIETGEIESVLERLDTVHQAVVVARADQSGEKRLAAYIVAADSGNPPSVGALRAALAAALPEYMMPGHFMTLEALPQTPNGKIDRKALPAPDMMPVADDHIAPRTVAEVVLAGIWADVLQRERVGSSDNFFALGGHSLLAAVAMAKMRATFRVDLPLRSLFESPTLEAMAHRIDETLRTRQGSDAAPAQANVRPHTKAAERWVTLDDNLSKLDGPAGAAQNVLLIPGAGNGADIYKPISRALHEAGINVFLVHHDGVDNELAPQESIPEMIDKYAAQIGRHCAGRFAVAGYCIGGTIGYAVMRTLRGSAFRPNGLFLFDAAIPSADVLALIESQAASPFDENEHMRGFFRAICARYSKETQPIGGGDFLHMTEDACIARAIASMQLSSGSQTQEWAKVLRKRYRAERAHTMAIRNYWSSRKGSELDRSAWDACPLTVLQSDEMHAQSPANAQAMQELGFGGVRIEKVPGKHEGFLLDHHQAIVGALTGHAEQRIVDAA